MILGCARCHSCRWDRIERAKIGDSKAMVFENGPADGKKSWHVQVVLGVIDMPAAGLESAKPNPSPMWLTVGRSAKPCL